MILKGKNQFMWSNKDICDIINEDIIMKNVHPVPVNTRGFLGLSKNDLKTVQTKMVVFLLIFFSLFSSLFTKAEKVFIKKNANCSLIIR